MLTVLIDSREYSFSNCYQHQLIKTLEKSFELDLIELSELRQKKPKGPVLSCLKLRTLDRNVKQVRECVGDTPVMVYEQDPWENFIVGSPYFGSYKRIASQINVSVFFNTSKWWSDRVNEQGLKSEFVNLWMLPEYCVAPKPWSERSHDVIFCGTLYPRRQRFFDELKRLGLDVTVQKSSMSYTQYLEFVSTCRIMIRSEKIDWNVSFGAGDHLLEIPNALWIRDVECASRGCFSMRELDQEKLEWELDDVPSIVSFSTPEEAVQNVNRILATDVASIEKMLSNGSEQIKSMNKWQRIVDAIKRHSA
jgi:hypothetical protein